MKRSVKKFLWFAVVVFLLIAVYLIWVNKPLASGLNNLGLKSQSKTLSAA